MIRLDHIGVPTHDAAASARFLAEILGLALATPEGPDGDMYWLPIGESGALKLSFSPALSRLASTDPGRP